MSDNATAGTYNRQIGGFNFKTGQPDNADGKEYCASILSETISDANCNTYLNYLCERPGTYVLPGFRSRIIINWLKH